MHGSCMHVSFSIKDYISLGDWAPHPIYYLISLGHVCVSTSVDTLPKVSGGQEAHEGGYFIVKASQPVPPIYMYID